VAGSSGPVSGITWMRAVSAFTLGTARGTSRTPGIAATSDRIPSTTPRGSSDSTIVPVMMSGPFRPGPKCSAIRSNVTRSGVPGGFWPEFGRASSRSRAGRLSARSPPTTSTTVSSGSRVTTPTHRREVAPGWRRVQDAAGRSRSPAYPSSAGSAVSARATSIVTAREANAPMIVRKGSPATAMPASAMTFVVPANTTAEPAVPVARATDSSSSIPVAS